MLLSIQHLFGEWLALMLLPVQHLFGEWLAVVLLPVQHLFGEWLAVVFAEWLAVVLLPVQHLFGGVACRGVTFYTASLWGAACRGATSRAASLWGSGLPWCYFPYSISLGSGLGLVSLLLLAGRDLLSGVEHMDGKRLSRVSI